MSAGGAQQGVLSTELRADALGAAVRLGAVVRCAARRIHGNIRR